MDNTSEAGNSLPDPRPYARLDVTMLRRVGGVLLEGLANCGLALVDPGRYFLHRLRDEKAGREARS